MQHTSKNEFLKRIAIIAFIQFVLMFIIVVRLYVLQVLHSEQYKTLSDDNRIRVRLTLPNRGHIYDRNGKPLATNTISYRTILIPEDAPDIKKTLQQVSSVLSLSQDEIDRILKKIKQKPRFLPTVVKDDLTWDQVSAIEINMLELPGLSVEEGRGRDYSLGRHTSHALGYIAAPSDEEAKTDKSLMLPGAKVGKNGIEKSYEASLQGIAGQKEVEVNAHGRIIRELRYTPSIPGKDLHLTLHKDLQDYTSKLLEPYNSVSAIVLDIHTGEVLSLVSVPGYDPELFFNGIDQKTWDGLINNKYAPMTNKVISGQYSPASTFKIAVALSALGVGVSPKENYFCPGFMMMGRHKFHCWKKGGHGSVDMHQAIMKSCDVFFYQTAKKIDEGPIISTAQNLGVGTKTGIDIPYEQSGFIASPEWKRRVKKLPWYPGDTILTSIGQGYVLMTPIQLALMMAEIANGGVKITPHLAKKENVPAGKSLNVSKKNLKFLLAALSDAVNSPSGTSYRSRIKEKKWQMGGKTGTAQVRRITMAERESGVRKESELPWELRNHSLFVGFAPVDNPRFAVAVVGAHLGFGSSFAAPMGKEILTKTQELMEKEDIEKAQQKKVQDNVQ